ncbi:MAG TPA: hypothetical protein VM163_10535 [bacterium]|nr:hypothetical protein [bacterium]
MMKLEHLLLSLPGLFCATTSSFFSLAGITSAKKATDPQVGVHAADIKQAHKAALAILLGHVFESPRCEFLLKLLC